MNETYSRTQKRICKFIFHLLKGIGARAARLVGEFNNSDKHKQATTMKRNKNGSLSFALNVEAGKEYHLRYQLDVTRCETQGMVIATSRMNVTAQILWPAPENIRQNGVFRRGRQDYFNKGSDLKTHLCHGGFEDQWVHARFHSEAHSPGRSRGRQGWTKLADD